MAVSRHFSPHFFWDLCARLFCAKSLRQKDATYNLLFMSIDPYECSVDENIMF